MTNCTVTTDVIHQLLLGCTKEQDQQISLRSGADPRSLFAAGCRYPPLPRLSFIISLSTLPDKDSQPPK